MTPPGSQWPPPQGPHAQPPSWQPPPYGPPQGHGYGYPPPKKPASKGAAIAIIAGVSALSIAGMIGRAVLDKRKPKPNLAAIDSTAKQLGAIHAALGTPGDASEQACPKDLPPGDPLYGVHLATYEALARFDGASGKGSWKSRTDEPWDFSDDSIFNFRRMEDEYAANDAEILKKGRYLLVVRATAKTPPTFPEKGTFMPGSFAGVAVLFDLASGKRLCQTPIAAESSATVTHREKGIVLGSTSEEAVMEDLRTNVRKAADAGLHRIAPNLTTLGL